MPSVKLTPALQYLLKIRSPDPFSGPSASVLNNVFKSTLGGLESSVKPSSESSVPTLFHGGPLSNWLVITTATLLTANVPSSLGHLYRFATSSDSLSLAQKAERTGIMREAGMKCSVIVGFPRVINGLGALREATEPEVVEELERIHVDNANSEATVNFQERGSETFNKFYTPYTDKLLHKLGQSHPDFPGYIVEHAYGALLSRPLVSRTATSALAIACLRTQGRVGPQLTSHVFGLLKAGVEGEPQTPTEKWLSSPEGVEWVIETVDQLCDAVHAESEQ